jgi:hypothetical protein
MARPLGSKTDPNRKRMPFKQSEVERAIKAVEARKLPISAVEINPTTGAILISIGTPSPGGDGDSQKNSWDEVLPNASNKIKSA